MKKTRFAFALLGIGLALSGCGAENAEAAPLNIWPWLLGLLGLAVLALAGYQTYCYMIYLRNARRRRRKNTHGVEPLTIILYGVAAALLLMAFLTAGMGAASSDPTNSTTDPAADPTDGTTEPTVFTGWVDENGSRYYMLADGSFATGWMEMDGRLYYFQDNGLTLSGWHTVEDVLRYFRADGSMARGQEEVDGKTLFFTSTGAQLELTNPWHPIPDDYTVELKDLSVVYAVDGIKVDVRIYDALKKMMDDCNKAMAAEYPKDPPRCCVTSGYRTHDDQIRIYKNRVNKLMREGLSREEAEAEADTEVAAAGYSEHQLGLAVDIIDTDSWKLDSFQADLPAQQWLLEHCWEYGFILRYPEGTTEITGIIYEPWHYRYVGLELSMEMKENGLTLEEYLNNLD